MLSLVVLFVLLLIATYTDIRWQSIYNWTTYPGLFLAFLIRSLEEGQTGAEDALAGALGCGGIMLICFLLFQLGGGDLKLLAMIGAFLGWQRGFEALLWTFILGSIGGITAVIWQLGAWNIMQRTAAHLRRMVQYRGPVPLTDADRAPLQRMLFLAPAALVAAVIVTADRWGGH